MDKEQFIQFLEDFAPKNLAEEWDNVGFLLGKREGELTRVYICLDVDAYSVDTAIEEGCDCPACKGIRLEDGSYTGGYSRAYIRHLLKAKEMLGMRLCVLHNLSYYNRLMREMRFAIREGRWEAWKTDALYKLKIQNS